MIKVKEVEIKIQNWKDFKKESLKETEEIDKGIFKGPKVSVTFSNISLFRKFLTPKRLELLRIIKAKKPSSLYKLSKMTNRPLKSINRDINIMEEIGLIDLNKTKNKRPNVVPSVSYDRIDVSISI